MDYNSILAAATAKTNPKSTKSVPNNNPSTISNGIYTEAQLDSFIGEMDEKVFGAYTPQENEAKEYDPYKELELYTSINNGGYIPNNKINTKIPKEIFESITQNPLCFNTMPSKNDPINILAEKASSKMSGITAATKIMEKVEGKDKITKKISNAESGMGNSTIDYSLIKTIVENVVDNKLETFKNNILTEGKSNNSKSPNVSVMQLKENGSFLFLDSDNNIYECKLTYKGKNKAKKR